MRKMILPAVLFTLCFTVCACFLGCSSLAKKDQINPALLEPQTNLRFADIPVPAGFKLLSNGSYVFESGGIRAGVLKYHGKADIDQVVSFFKEQMTMFNWNLINVVEYDQHLMNFDRENETCIINMTAKGRSINIAVTLGPKSQGATKKAKEKEPMK